MAEGVGAPFLVGAVCFLTLFWHSGQRWWIAAAGVALALAFASLYEAVPYGAAVFLALAAGVLWSSEARTSMPQGRLRAVEGLGLLLVIPSLFVGVLWIVANATIMGQPLFFVNGAYGYATYKSEAFTGGSPDVAGDLAGIATLLGERIWPFLIPLAALLALRAVDRRLARIETVSLLAVGLSVTLGLIAPMAYLGSRMDFLRYEMYPLYAAAGYGDPVVTRARLADYLADRVVSPERHVLLDAYQGAAVAAQLPAAKSRFLVMTFDRRFRAALADPVHHNVSYILVPDPATWPQDIVNRTRPRLWAGKEPGFALVKTFEAGSATRLPEDWRLFAVQPDARVLATTSGGNG
jgi:hypothetical protein